MTRFRLLNNGSPAGLVSFVAYAGVALILAALPLGMSSPVVSILTKVLIFGLFAASLNVVFGYAGLFSLGHAAFFGTAGYVAGILITRYGVENFWLVAPAGILAAVVVGGIFGIIALRVSGVYFLLVTLALGQLVYSILWKWTTMTGGSQGVPRIPVPQLMLPWHLDSAISFYYFALAVSGLCFFLLYRIVHSPFGHALRGIRENEPRMQALGYNTWAYKYTAFVLGALFAGIAGVLYAHFNGIMMPADAGFIQSFMVLLMVIIGSTGTPFGPFLGAAVVVLLQYFSSLYFPERWPILLGAIFVLCVMYLRGGIGVHLLRLWEKARVRLERPAG